MIIYKFKGIVLFVVFSLIITGFGFVSASAESESNVSDLQYQRAIDLLEIISAEVNFEQPDDTITRREFITAAVSLLEFKTSDGTDEPVFEDVDKEEALSGILFYAVKSGFISKGVKFFPDAPITYAQALKIVLSVAGYSIEANYEGGYPLGYIKIANRLNFIKTLSKFEQNSKLTKEDAILMLSETLSIDILKQTSFGTNQKYESHKYENILSEYHDIYTVEGILEANQYAFLYNKEKKLRDGMVRIDGIDYEIETDDDLLGYNVVAYYRDDTNSNKSIVYMYPDNSNKTLSINGLDIVSLSNNKLYYYNNDKVRDILLSPEFSVVKNGKVFYSENLESELKDDNSFITLIDNDNDNRYDLISFKKYNYLYVSNVDYINLHIFGDNQDFIDLSDSDCVFKIMDKLYNGTENIDIHQLESNSLIAYTVSEDGLLYNIQTCNSLVDGTIKSIDYGRSIVEIDDIEYKLNSYFLENYPNIKTGNKGVFSLGIDNSIVVFKDTTSSLHYGFVNAVKSSGSLINPIYEIKIYSEDGEFKIFNFANKVKLDNVRKKADEVAVLLDNIVNSSDLNRVIKYSLNNDGEINVIDTASKFETIGDTFNKIFDKNDSLFLFCDGRSVAGGYKYKSTPKMFAEKFRIDDSTKIFAIPPENERYEDDFSMLTTSYFRDDKFYNISGYDLNSSSGIAGAAIIIEKVATQPSNLVEYTCVVDEKFLTYNEDEGTVYGLRLWTAGENFIEVKATNKCNNIIETIDEGDIVRCEYDENFKIKSISLDYDFSEGDNRKPVGADSECEYKEGMIYDCSKDAVYMVPSDVDWNSIDNMQISDLSLTYIKKYVVVEINKRTDGTVSNISIMNTPIESIQSYKNSSNKADFIIVRQMYNIGQVGFIYRVY